MLAPMASEFGERLTKAREAAGLSGYKLVQVTGIAQGNLQAIERGRRSPSDANLEALAAVPELGVTLEQLQAWRDLDRIGLEGIERIRKWVPEVLEGGKAAEPARKEAASPLEAIRAQFPKGIAHPPTDRELKLLARMGDLEEYDLQPSAPIWTFPASERWPEVKDAYEAWKEDQEDLDAKKA